MVKVIVSDVATNYGIEIDCVSYSVALFMCKTEEIPAVVNVRTLLYVSVRKVLHKSNTQLYYFYLALVVPNLPEIVSLHSILLAPSHVVF